MGGGRPPLPILIFKTFLFFLRVWPPTLVHLEWGAPPGPLGGAPLGFVVITWGVCPRSPLPILILKIFLFFLGVWPPILVNLEWGAPPGPLGGAPLGFVVMTWGVCPRPPLPILIFPVFLIFLRFMPPTLVNLEWGAPPGPLGGAPLALVLPLGALRPPLKITA